MLAAGMALARERGEPGRYDYLVLSLSWSPSFCGDVGDKTEPMQCAPGRNHGFVVHGLWPQYDRGSPEYCAAARRLPPALVESMLPLMPSRSLIAHQWRKHGTCFGDGPEAYFSATRAAAQRVRVPSALRAPSVPLRLGVAELEGLFAQTNPGLDGGAIAVRCKGADLVEVQICLDRGLAFRRCAADVRDRCRKDKPLVVPPVR